MPSVRLRTPIINKGFEAQKRENCYKNGMSTLSLKYGCGFQALIFYLLGGKMEPVYKRVQIWYNDDERLRLIIGRNYVRVERYSEKREYDISKLGEIINTLKKEGYRIGYSFMDLEFY